MKKSCILAVLVLWILASGLVWAGEFGAPEPMAQPGKFTLGIGYFYSSEKLKPADEAFSGQPNFWKKANFRSNQAYLQGDFGLFKNWEVFGRVGGADQRIDDAFNFGTSQKDFSDEMRVFGTLGFKGLFWSNSTFAVGPVFQASYYSKYKDTATGSISGTPVTLAYTLDENWDVNLAISAQAKLFGTTLFAGPFFYYKNATADLAVTAPGATPLTGSSRYHSDLGIGGLAGLRVPIMKRFFIEIEGQYTNKASAGANFTFAF